MQAIVQHFSSMYMQKLGLYVYMRHIALCILQAFPLDHYKILSRYGIALPYLSGAL